MIDSTIIISVAAMGGLGIFFAAFLAIADRKLRVEEDPLVEAIACALPGANCGGCGYAGCRQLAEMIASRRAPISACPPGGQSSIDAIAKLLGVEAVKREPIVAVVLCRGGNAEAKRNADYRGERTCMAADLTNGAKACIYGCHGYGDCVRACQFDAMDMSPNGLPVVFRDRCVGCGACARACPRDLIEMHPVERELFVYCKSRDKGPVAKKACSAACIACGICVKACEVPGGIVLKDNLAEINYDTCPQNDVPTKKCPTRCILFGIEPLVTSESYYASVKRAG
jgi:RnfABCDGE-type electron transport complex B subunit